MVPCAGGKAKWPANSKRERGLFPTDPLGPTTSLMRSEQVLTNLRCNQHCLCCMSRCPQDEPSFVRPRAVARRIANAVGQGEMELVLTGGEPTLHPHLARFVALAKKLGARRLVLETNATRIGPDQAAALSRAGLDLARVHMSSVDASWDRVTRDPGGTEAALRGVRCLLDAGLGVEIAALAIRSTAAMLPELPKAITAAFPKALAPRAIRVAVPVRSPLPDEVLSPTDAASVVTKLARACRLAGIPCKLDPRAHPAPCVFEDTRTVAPLFSLGPSRSVPADHERVPACEACFVRDGCPGFERVTIERFGEPDVQAIAKDTIRRRLTMVGSESEQVERELVEPSRGWVGDEEVDEAIVRVMFACNQDCSFCFVSTHLPTPSLPVLLRAIDEAAARGARIVLSGGEPTLHPSLLEIVRHAKRVSGYPVQLQTNAVRCADGTLAADLREAGLDEVFVSLHGATTATSEAITRAPGTHERTVRGLDRLHATGMSLTVNFVTCASNMGELVALVGKCAERWPGARLNVSFVAPATDLVRTDKQTIPRLTDALPHVVAAVEAAESLGVSIGGFASMCGMPRCLVPERISATWTSVQAGLGRGEFVHPTPCRRCAARPGCLGLRRRYVEMYGDEELRPMSAVPSPGVRTRRRG
jgi:MoaA/NifB/PqqE/SkfB family radical SAM enzyme